MQCLWHINALKWYLSQTHSTHGRSVAIYVQGFVPLRLSGCFAHFIVGNAFWENNCPKVVISFYTKLLNLQVITMVFRLVTDFDSGECQVSPDLGELTLWFPPHIKRCMRDHHSWPNFNYQAMQLSPLSDHQKDLEIWGMN